VFDRGREQVRHEYQQHDLQFGKLPPRELVVLHKDSYATVQMTAVNILPRDWHILGPHGIPLDPIAAGLFTRLREPIYAGAEKVRRDHDLQGFEDFLFKVTPDRSHLKREIRAFQSGAFVVLMLKIHNPNLKLDFVRRTILDPAKNYAPVRSIDTHSQFGKPSGSMTMLNVNWQQRGEIWIPTLIDEHDDHRWERKRRMVSLDWKSVNQPISADEFDFFQLTPNGHILGMDHLPAARQEQLLEKSKAAKLRSSAFQAASWSGVLRIDATTVFPSGRQTQRQGLAIVVDEQGYLVTAHHLLDGADTIQVNHNLHTFPARVVASDPAHDLDMIRIEPKIDFRVPLFGMSSALRMGATVYVTQEPFSGLRAGRITAIDCDLEVSPSRKYKNLIRTNTPFSAEAIGGPLINTNAEIIGINIASQTGEQNMGFAIPTDEARKIIAELFAAAARNESEKRE
jgi:Trypsin-like peptidase domain